MGLDIRLVAVDGDDLLGLEHVLDESLRSAHRLSRSFCNLVWRRYGLEETTELDQIAELIGLDVSPLYDMAGYSDDRQVLEMLERATSEKQRQEVDSEIAMNRARLAGNLAKVLALVSSMVDKLAKIADLPARLVADDFDPLDRKNYFAQADADVNHGSTWPRFGQDLRNFCNFLEYAKSKGVTSVGFQFGW